MRTSAPFLLCLMLALVHATVVAAAAPPRAEILFRLANPCPATGQTSGACKGYVIDRILPIVCGGAEDPSNMQWQTLAQAREKDRWEKIGCRPGRKLVLPTPAVDADVFPMQEAPAVPEAQPLPRG